MAQRKIRTNNEAINKHLEILSDGNQYHLWKWSAAQIIKIALKIDLPEDKQELLEALSGLDESYPFQHFKEISDSLSGISGWLPAVAV